MPEHFHLLISEPKPRSVAPSLVMQVLEIKKPHPRYRCSRRKRWATRPTGRNKVMTVKMLPKETTKTASNLLRIRELNLECLDATGMLRWSLPTGSIVLV